MAPKGQQDDPLVSTHIHTYSCIYMCVCMCYVRTQKLKCELLPCYVTSCN